MTRAEILNCLTDRPCDVCRFHESGRCERWDCVFEEKPDDAEGCEDKRMTREEAIAKLKNFADHCYPNEEFLMAIKALSAEPCEDAISRAEAMTEIMMFAGNVKPDEENIYIKVSDAVQLLRELPSVTPKQKVGRWIFDDKCKEHGHCSLCGYGSVDLMDGEPHDFCRRCGAKMEESENG